MAGDALGRLGDVLDEHTLSATTNRVVLRTGETVHECNSGCADDLIERLRAVGVVVGLGRAMGRDERTVEVEVVEMDIAAVTIAEFIDVEQLALPLSPKPVTDHFSHTHLRSTDAGEPPPVGARAPTRRGARHGEGHARRDEPVRGRR